MRIFWFSQLYTDISLIWFIFEIILRKNIFLAIFKGYSCVNTVILHLFKGSICLESPYYLCYSVHLCNPQILIQAVASVGNWRQYESPELRNVGVAKSVILHFTELGCTHTQRAPDYGGDRGLHTKRRIFF